jgi:nudix-type nucleoside diphosphatase (YffH/AdpP family)
VARIVFNKLIHEGWARFSVATIVLDDGQTIRREIEDHGRAVAVLPYDPGRRMVMLVRQMRAPMLATSGELLSLEAPAGLLDEETLEECARREALEECGLRLGALEHIASAWSMPGISTERMDLYLAAFASEDRIAAGGGLADEHEQIECVEMTCSDLAALIDAGELRDMKTLTLALALWRRHPHLFG